MKNDIKKLIAKTISDNYYDLLLVGYEEQQHRFFITLTIIDFLAKLKEKNINYNFFLFHKFLYDRLTSDYRRNGSSQMFLLSVLFVLCLDISCTYMLLTYTVTAFLSLILYLFLKHFF